MSQTKEYDGSKPLKDPKQEKFCQEAVATNSFKEAYKAIGLKRPRGNADRYARQPRVHARLAHLWAASAKQVELMGGRHLLSMDRIASANIFDFWDIDQDTGSLGKLNLNKAPYVMGSVIQEIAYDTKGRPKLRLHDAVAAGKFLIERAMPKPQRHEIGAPGEFDKIEDAAELRSRLIREAEELGAGDIAAALIAADRAA